MWDPFNTLIIVDVAINEVLLTESGKRIAEILISERRKEVLLQSSSKS